MREWKNWAKEWLTVWLWRHSVYPDVICIALSGNRVCVCTNRRLNKLHCISFLMSVDSVWNNNQAWWKCVSKCFQTWVEQDGAAYKFGKIHVKLIVWWRRTKATSHFHHILTCTEPHYLPCSRTRGCMRSCSLALTVLTFYSFTTDLAIESSIHLLNSP